MVMDLWAVVVISFFGGALGAVTYEGLVHWRSARLGRKILGELEKGEKRDHRAEPEV